MARMRFRTAMAAPPAADVLLSACAPGTRWKASSPAADGVSSDDAGSWAAIALHVATVLDGSSLHETSTAMVRPSHFGDARREILTASDAETTAVRICEPDAHAVLDHALGAPFLLEGEDWCRLAVRGRNGERATAGGTLHVPRASSPASTRRCARVKYWW